MHVEKEQALKHKQTYTEPYTLYTSQHPYPDARSSFFILGQAFFKVKRGKKTSSALTEDIFTVASLEPALQPHVHSSHSHPLHYVKDNIPLVYCLWGKSQGEGDQPATKLVPGTARSPALWRHIYAWDPSGHMEILEGREGRAHRGNGKKLPLPKVEPCS